MMCPSRDRGFGLESAWKIDVRFHFDCFAVSFTIYCIERRDAENIWKPVSHLKQIGCGLKVQQGNRRAKSIQKSLHFCYPSLRFIILISISSWIPELNGFTVTEKYKQMHFSGHDIQWYNVTETLRVGFLVDQLFLFAKKQSTSRLRPVRCSTSIGIY